MEATTGSKGFKSVEESQVVITELMVPNHANFGGKIHGGYILSLLDKIAYVCAAKHADTYCVTASVDTVDFHHPVEVGDLLHLYASVNYVGKTSLLIGVKVVAENFRKKTKVHTNSCYITMVAMTTEGEKMQVPGLKLTNELQYRRFIEGKIRLEMKREFRTRMDEGKKTWKQYSKKLNETNDNYELDF